MRFENLSSCLSNFIAGVRRYDSEEEEEEEAFLGRGLVESAPFTVIIIILCSRIC